MVERVHAGKFDRAAQIVGGLRAQSARALRHAGAADIVGDDGAADVQPVEIAIGRIAQRHAIQREAKLVLVEAADRDARGPFIGAEGIGALEVDRGQVFDGLERAGGGRQHGQILDRQRLGLTHLALAHHHDGIGFTGIGGASAGSAKPAGQSALAASRIGNRISTF
jgi:hypothetical protein